MVKDEYMLFLFKRLKNFIGLKNDYQEITSMLCCNGVLLSLVCQFLMRDLDWAVKGLCNLLQE